MQTYIKDIACDVGEPEPQRDPPASESVFCVHNDVQALRIHIAVVHLHASSGNDSQGTQHTI